MKKNSLLILLACFLMFCLNLRHTFAQDTAKIMGYNLLNYNTGQTRNVYFKKTMAYASPDILSVCEIISEAAMNEMLNDVLNANTPGLYSAGTFLDGPDTDNAVFFKTAKFTFISNTPVHTDLRDINMFTLVHNLSRDTIRIFMVHLKASSGTSEEAQRLSEVNSVRTVTNAFAAGTEFLILGDFNIYRSTEACYSRMLEVEAANDGQFVDSYNLPGTWNQAAYSPYHSQSTRVRQFGGGATGGLDDRFDFILNSTALTQEGRIKLIPNSLKPMGNDGNHYNDSINKRPNTAVPDSIADALYFSSDHLPVYALYKFDIHPSSISSISETNPGGFSLYQNYPNPFNPNTIIRYKLGRADFVKLKIYNSSGREVAFLVNYRQSAGDYKIEFDASKYPSGVYYYKLTANNYTETKSMVLVK